MSTSVISGGNSARMRSRCPASGSRLWISVEGASAMKKRIRTILAPGIRLQITLWYTAVFILLLVLVGVVSYLNVNSTLDANLDTSLALRARQIALGVSNDDGQFTIADEI